MPGPVYKDSMGRCEPPSMLYDTIRNPRGPHIPQKVESISKDTIESTQTRIHREVLEKFEGRGLKLPHESFVAVVQVGKYLFLAIMLPPYLCMYGIPRWFLVAALPQFFFFVKSNFLRVGHFIHEHTKRLTDLMKGMIDQTIGDALRMMQRHTRNLWGYLKDAKQNAMQAMQQRWDALQNMLKAAQQAALTPFKNAYNAMQTKLSDAGEWLAALAKHMANGVQNGLSKFQQLGAAAVVPVFHWLRSPVANTQALVKEAVNSLSAGIQAIAKRVNSFTDAIQNVLENIYEKTKQRWESFINPKGEWIQEKFESMYEAIRDRYRHVAAAISDTSTEIIRKFQEFASPKVQQVMHGIQAIPILAAQAAYSLWSRFPKGYKGKAQSKISALKRWGNAMKRYGGAGIHMAVKAVVHVTETLLVTISKGYSWLVDWMTFAFWWLRRQLIALPGRLLRGAVRLIHEFKKLFTRSSLFVRRLVAWVWVIFSHGMGLVQELADEISSWFSVKSQ